MTTLPEHGPKQASHRRPAMEWNVDEVIEWIQQEQNTPLNEDERKKLRTAHVSGNAFLSCNGDMGFVVKYCELSPGTAVVLARLSRELAKEETTAGIKRNIRQAGDADMSDTASKKPRLECKPGRRKLAESALRQRKLIRQKIKELDQSPVVPPSKDIIPHPNVATQFYDPNFDTELPFPFVGKVVPERFAVSLERNWFYMGREKFAELIHEFKHVYNNDRLNTLTVYGTRGYGKSHLLAALVCLLAAEKTNVVYVPDCRAFMDKPVAYMRAAMLFAWADDKTKQQTILTLDTLEAMDEFLEEQSAISEVVFVIDQLNALEEEKNDNASTIKNKSRLRQWLKGLVATAKGILSSSANNHTIIDGATKQDNSTIMYVYGGLNKTEMKCWWERKEKVKLADGEKFKVEDFTGCIPLFLDKCIVNGEINLDTPFFNDIYSYAATFELGIQKKCLNEKSLQEIDLHRHYEYMKACIYGEAVPIPSKCMPELVDHRYFYDTYDETLNRSVGHYSCGISRNAAGGVLLENRLRFFDKDYLDALPEFIDNPSVAGFMVEHAVLASIVLNGLKIIPGLEKPMNPEFFEGEFPRFNTKQHDPILYIPKVYTFRCIDGIIARIEETKTERKLFMYPLQITLGLEKHSDSRKGFFSEWTKWTKTLSDFKVVPEFLWISPKAASDINHKGTSKVPDHVERYILIGEVNKNIWKSYEKMKRDGKFRADPMINTIGTEQEGSGEQEESGDQEESGTKKGRGRSVRETSTEGTRRSAEGPRRSARIAKKCRTDLALPQPRRRVQMTTRK